METKKPVYGSLSIILPLTGLLAALIGSHLIHEPNEPHHLSVTHATIYASPLLFYVAGVASGIVGIYRHERFRWLPVLGLILSCLPILGLILSFSRAIDSAFR